MAATPCSADDLPPISDAKPSYHETQKPGSVTGPSQRVPAPRACSPCYPCFSLYSVASVRGSLREREQVRLGLRFVRIRRMDQHVRVEVQLQPLDVLHERGNGRTDRLTRRRDVEVSREQHPLL